MIHFERLEKMKSRSNKDKNKIPTKWSNTDSDHKLSTFSEKREHYSNIE